MSFYMFVYVIVYHRLGVLVPSENVALFLKT